MSLISRTEARIAKLFLKESPKLKKMNSLLLDSTIKKAKQLIDGIFFGIIQKNECAPPMPKIITGEEGDIAFLWKNIGNTLIINIPQNESESYRYYLEKKEEKEYYNGEFFDYRILIDMLSWWAWEIKPKIQN